MEYPFSPFSWDVISKNIAIKHMDKSAFLHHGTGIPKEIKSFFDLPEGELTQSKKITLKINEVSYEAHIQMDSLHERFRLFWKADFSNFIKQKFPDHYALYSSNSDVNVEPPKMKFLKESNLIFI